MGTPSTHTSASTPAAARAVLRYARRLPLSHAPSFRSATLTESLAALGVDQLAFGIHASAFPAGPADAGHGAPLSSAGRRLVDFAAGLGFSALQLGPHGQISDANPSPYDGTVFARELRSLDLPALCEPEFFELLTHGDLDALLGDVRADERRADPRRAARLTSAALDRAHAQLQRLRAQRADHPLLQALAEFRAGQGAWLELDALFETMTQRIGHDDPARFEPAVAVLFERSAAGEARRAALKAVLGASIERSELGQFLAYRQAQAFRKAAHRAGLHVLGDLQVGWSPRDRFLWSAAFAAGWQLGAPPSRTNPDGQPWGYPVLDPDQLDDPSSPARRAFALRIEHLLETHDGLRIDHPHGLVCPWIYRADALDPLRAVQAGARAFESPEADDPQLRRWAIARAADLNAGAATPWADDRVRTLDDAQVRRYSRLVDVVLAAVSARGGGQDSVAVEVLSTCPVPLAQVLGRHGLGRFRVTQKADPHDARDVYRTDRALPEDWVMLGNHDTPPIMTVAERWLRDGSAQARAAYLAQRLEPSRSRRAAAARAFCASPSALAQAHLADLFASDARHVLVYFTDLFGEREPFNRAGAVHPDNWCFRLAPDFERVYAERRRSGAALDIAAAVALALRARGARPDLAKALESTGQGALAAT